MKSQCPNKLSEIIVAGVYYNLCHISWHRIPYIKWSIEYMNCTSPKHACAIYQRNFNFLLLIQHTLLIEILQTEQKEHVDKGLDRHTNHVHRGTMVTWSMIAWPEHTTLEIMSKYFEIQTLCSKSEKRLTIIQHVQCFTLLNFQSRHIEVRHYKNSLYYKGSQLS